MHLKGKENAKENQKKDFKGIEQSNKDTKLKEILKEVDHLHQLLIQLRWSRRQRKKEMKTNSWRQIYWI